MDNDNAKPGQKDHGPSVKDMVKKLKKREGEPTQIAEEIILTTGRGRAVAKDVVSTESYELKKPFLGFFNKNISTEEAEMRLKAGEPIIVREGLKVEAKWEDGQKVRIYEVDAGTKLDSIGDMESFVRIESGEEPKSLIEKTAAIFEKLEMKKTAAEKTFFIAIKAPVTDSGGGIIGGKELSSLEAARRLHNGEAVLLEEHKITEIKGADGTRRPGATVENTQLVESVEKLQWLLKQGKI
jgi:hypothetical protein